MTQAPGAAYNTIFAAQDEGGARTNADRTPVATAARSSGQSRDATEAQVWRRLKSAGYSDVQAAAIMGNLSAESGLDPNAVGDRGQARGLAQWHGDRYAPLVRWAQTNQVDPDSLDGQVDMVQHELSTTEGRARRDLQDAQDLDAATGAFAGFERPAGWRRGGDPAAISHWERRRSEAQRYYDTYRGQ